MSASEIVAHLAAGTAHLGITGEDLIREGLADADEAVELLTPLGFGHANVVVAVPQAWIDVRTMADLDEVAADLRARHGRKMRVATKYVALTRRFFAERGIADYLIVESLGATEGAPSAGAAEIVVDITTTGATLRANALKVLDDGLILRSEANLVASARAPWTARARDAARLVLTRIAAEEEARTSREVRAALDPAAPIPRRSASIPLWPPRSSASPQPWARAFPSGGPRGPNGCSIARPARCSTWWRGCAGSARSTCACAPSITSSAAAIP